MKLSIHDIKGSTSFRRLNAAVLSPRCAGSPAVVESNPGDAPLATEEVQRPTRQRFLVRVTSVRKRLLDADNLCEKYHVDLCRYAGVIPDDSPDKVEIQVSQRKANKGEEEATIIEII
jgi:hypothetical protein